jgi:hypothetical protein
MEDFFNKVQDTVILAGKVVSEKAKNVTDVTKTKYVLSMKESDLRSKLVLLGEKYYNENKDNEDFANDELFLDIANLKDDIKDLQDRIKDLKNVKTCPECGCEVKSEARYCDSCGAKLY